MADFRKKKFNRVVTTPSGFTYDESGEEVVNKFAFNEPYVIKFTTDAAMDEILKIKSMVDRNVLDVLLMYMNFSTGTVTLNADRRKAIREKLKISPQAYSRSMKNLTDLGFIKKHDIVDETSGEVIETLRDEIDINPIVYWQGDLSKRNQIVGK